MPRKKAAVAEPEAPPEVEEDFETDEDELEELEETDKEPAPVEPEHTGPTPHYLDSLLALPGVPADIMEGIDPHKAWLTVISRDMPAQALPLGHLAPDALTTLQEIGYERHARFELKPTHNSTDVRYFAAVLPDLPEDDSTDDDDEPSSAMVALIRSQDARMTRLEELVVKLAEGNADPFKQIERALVFVERIHESVGAMRGSDGDGEIIKTAIEQLVPRLLPGPAPEKE